MPGTKDLNPKTSPHSTLISPLAESYWIESRQPLMSLVFIMPMMLIYEAGVWKLGVQNGADEWMAKVLSLMDFRLHIFLPLLMAAILLGWHHLTHHPWRIIGRGAFHDGRRIAAAGGLPADGFGAAKHDGAANRRGAAALPDVSPSESARPWAIWGRAFTKNCCSG